MKLLLISPVLFAVACCLPALEFRNSGTPNDVMLGLRALAVGWSGIFAGVFGWYANPFWAFGLLLSGLRKGRAAAVFGVIAMALAATTFSDIGRELPGDEGNVTRTAILRLLPGCYVWMAALA
ncbi:MAG: hypothetical protein ABJF23_06265, partial [Bryobacteraceae bacterium]